VVALDNQAQAVCYKQPSVGQSNQGLKRTGANAVGS